MGVQKEGVAFLYDRVVRQKQGCILAHSMGLGKTFQVRLPRPYGGLVAHPVTDQQIVVFTGLFFQQGLGRTALVVAPKRFGEEKRKRPLG